MSETGKAISLLTPTPTEKEEEPKELLLFLKKKLEGVSSLLSTNASGNRNGSIGEKIGRMYQAILFELDKQKK